jgi:hypothetical protein
MFSSVKRRLLEVSSVAAALLFSLVASVPAQAHTLQLVTHYAEPIASDCGGSACAVAYSMARSTPYFASAPTGSTDANSKDDSQVVAEEAALSKCYDHGATDCDVATWVENGYISVAIDFGWPNPAKRPWGDGWGPTEAAAEYWSNYGCQHYAGNSPTCLLSTEYSIPSPGSPATGSCSGECGAAGSWGALDTKAGYAIVWAFDQLGSRKWNDECLVFVQLAYGQIGGGWALSKYTGSAAEAYGYLNEKGLVHHKGTPDIGALVWFQYLPKDPAHGGHVGIYLGHNEFLSATETHHGVQINNMTAWEIGVGEPYLGWSDASFWHGRSSP